MPNTPNGLSYPDSTAHTRLWDHLHDAALSVDARYGLSVATWADLAAITTPFKGMRVWVDSLAGLAVYTGAKWLAPPATVRKTADETVTSSAVLQDDDVLLYAIPAAGTYEIDVRVIVTAANNVNGKIRVGATFPAGTMILFGEGLTQSLSGGSEGSIVRFAPTLTSGVDPALGYGVSTLPTHIGLRFLFVATAAGTFKFQWAQVSSNAVGTTVKAGSHLDVRNVA